MGQIKTVLAATDLSAPARHAAARAARLSDLEDTLKRLRQLGAEAGLDPGRIPYVILHGDASRRIVEQEQEQDCDLIMLGKHGRNILGETLLGSVRKHVLAESGCKLVVSARPSAGPGPPALARLNSNAFERHHPSGRLTRFRCRRVISRRPCLTNRGAWHPKSPDFTHHPSLIVRDGLRRLRGPAGA